MPYTRKAEVFEATTWTKPTDMADTSVISIDAAKGKVLCTRCGKPLAEHWTRTGQVLQDMLCPGMVVLKGNQGTVLYMTDSEFKEQFEEIPK